MKKNILLILSLIMLILTTKQAICAVDPESSAFIAKFASCANYVDNDEKRITAVLGWSTRRCYYEEVSHTELVTCSFKQLELLDAAKIMRSENFNLAEGIADIKGMRKYFHPSYGNCTKEIRNSQYINSYNYY